MESSDSRGFDGSMNRGQPDGTGATNSVHLHERVELGLHFHLYLAGAVDRIEFIVAGRSSRVG